jgi:hypothetical protein
MLHFYERLSFKKHKTKIQGVILSLLNTKCNAPIYSAHRRAHNSKYKEQSILCTTQNIAQRTLNGHSAERETLTRSTQTK